MKRKGSWMVVAAALVMGAAWTLGEGDVRTDPAPVDAMLDAGAAETGVAPAGSFEAPAVSSSAVRLASTQLRPRAAWDLRRTTNDRVEYWIGYLSGRNRDRMRLWLEREGRYGPMIRERLAERGMPQDLVYLAMIESGLSPKAYSHAHASGMWQFISETGRRYGLEVTSFVDERRDPVQATDAALDYLSELHERFGSWYLAAAAYNSGENRVERVLRERVGGQKGDDGLFWMIDQHLPRETRDYVPLMLAAAHIGKDPGRYGFPEIVLQAPLAYEEVAVPGGVSLRSVAEAAGVEVGVIEELNAHFLRGITPPGADVLVRVPTGVGDRVLMSVDGIVEEGRLATVTHRVGRGETLSHIARSYGVSVAMLTGSNGHVNPRRLQVGQRILVPVDGRLKAQAAAPTWRTYRVRKGDSLWAIARRNGVSVSQIRSWNGIGNRIYPGQRLRIQA